MAIQIPGVETASKLFRAMWRDPLVRNGNLLTISSLAASGIGVVFWAAAAWSYSAEIVGQAYAVIAAVALLAGVAQVNLTSGLIRFLQPAGKRAPRLIAGSYAIAVSLSVLLGVAFVLLIPRLSPELNFVNADLLLSAAFVAMVVCTAVFHLQDSALTGVRETLWVPIENTAFAVVKLGLLVTLAAYLPSTGIVVSWLSGLVICVVGVSFFIFLRALPKFVRSSPDHDHYPGTAAVVKFVAADNIGATLFLATNTVLPLIVINSLGAEANAYFSTAWLITTTLLLVGANMGLSMVVETAIDQDAITQKCREMLAHTAKLVVPVTLIACVAAPIPLRLLGKDYADNATDVLRILVLSAIPNILVATATATAWARRRVGFTNLVRALQCVGVLGGSALVVGDYGMIGVAWIVLGVECVLAILVWFVRPLWLAGRTAG